MPIRSIARPILFLSVTGAAFAIAALLTLAIPISTAQVGVPYNSSLAPQGGQGGIPPYTYTIISGQLPPGLILNGGTGAITGTPNSIGTFTFTARVTDSAGVESANSMASARRGTSQAAPPVATATSPLLTITVAPAAGAAGAPIPTWALLAMAMGLALAGLYHLRRMGHIG